MDNNEFIRGKRAEIDLVSDGIYNCEELKELMKAFGTSELKLKNEVIPEEFYVSSTPATKSEIQEILDCLKESNRSK